MTDEPAAEWTLKVDLAELREALRLVLDHVEQESGPTVSIPADYFWAILPPTLYDPMVDPKVTMGQLSDSWGLLAKARQGDGESIVAHQAVWLGDILTAIGHHARG